MELTKKQAIEEHRKMWNWIAKQIKTQPLEERFSTPCYNWVNLISDLKRYYLYDFKEVENNCFCCEYAFNTSGYDQRMCDFCPLVWSGIGCCDASGEYLRLISLNGYSDENKENAYELALKIANLPEKKGV